MRKFGSWLAITLLLSLTACGWQGGTNEPKAPVVKSFTVNGVSFDPDSGQGLIVTTAGSLELKASVSGSYAIQSVTISYAKRPSTDFTALEPCATLSCTRTWTVTQSDNGAYDFRVQAVDTKGNSATVNYPASVAIAIH